MGTMILQDAGLLSEALKAAPSAVSTVLVIVVVWAFLRHERARDRDFREMLADSNQVNSDQRAQSIAALSENTRLMTEAMGSLGRNMENLARGQERVLETQASILEAVHSCRTRNQA